MFGDLWGLLDESNDDNSLCLDLYLIDLNKSCLWNFNLILLRCEINRCITLIE